MAIDPPAHRDLRQREISISWRLVLSKFLNRGGYPWPWIGGIYESAKTKTDVATVGARSEALVVFHRRNGHGIMVPAPKNDNRAHCAKFND